MTFDENKIKELYPGAEKYMFEPMLITKGTEKSISLAAESGEYFGQLKKDGALYMLVKGDTGASYLFGRTVSKKTGLLTEKGANVPHIMELADYIPKGTVILGEIYYPGKTSKDVTSIMGCLPANAISRQKGAYGYIHYYIYDILFDNGVDLRNEGSFDRYCKLLTESYHWVGEEFLEDHYIEIAELFTDDLINRANKALADGEEGMVFKKKDGIYQPGKRPTYNLKVKQSDTIDAFIIGAEDPTEKYTGKDIENWDYWISDDENKTRLSLEPHYGEPNCIPVTKHYYYKWKNAIKIGVYGDNGEIIDIGTVASGLDDTLRKELAENFQDYNMRVAKIQCMSIDKKAKTLRHAFFKGFHDDKNPQECLASVIFS